MGELTIKETKNNCASCKFIDNKPKQTEDEIKVGDEVKYYDDFDKSEKTGIITNINEEYNYAFILKSDGEFCTVVCGKLIRTGKNYPQITEVLEQMKEEE